MDKLWCFREQDSLKAQEIARSLGVSEVVAQVMINRGISSTEEARNFLNPRLSDLIPPEEMPGVPKALQRIKKAINEEEKITIYGDYDVDGITSTSIIWWLIKILDGKADYYIPHRIEEGYGLNENSIRELAEAGTNLIITVDCGITAIKAVDLANELGMDIIITDHHQPKESMPNAFSIVHPLIEESYPAKSCSGAMVAFKLAWAIAKDFSDGPKTDEHLKEFLLNATDFATLGTIADVMDMRGENRSLAHYGLKAIAQTKLPGMRALLDSAELSGKDLNSTDIAFGIAPMLNAAGRMGHARLAVELLTSDNDIRSLRIVEYLKQQNTQRRTIERKILKHAKDMIVQMELDHPDQKSIVLGDESWHQGVIGIVASKIIEKYYRPTILLNCSNGTSSGSARSIEGFNILKAIAHCKDHLIGFGGHSMAAGLRIETKNIPAFRLAFEEYTRANLKEEDSISKLEIEAIYPIAEFTESVVRDIERLGPFGNGNPKPVFATRGVRLLGPPRKVGAKGDHIQIAIRDNSSSMRCIGFNMGHLEKKLTQSDFFSIAYEPQINNYNGEANIQFVITDIQFD